MPNHSCEPLRQKFRIGLACAVIALSSCGGGGGSSTPPPPPQPGSVQAPTLAPSAGSFSSVQVVSLASATSGAAIHYTTDGTAPTTASPTYAGPLVIAATTTVRAFAQLSGLTDSTAVSADYTLTAGTPAVPQYTWQNVQIVAGGYITGIVAHPAQQDLFYARTDIGGAYRWNATGARWIALNDWHEMDDWNLTGIESIGLDPSDPNLLYLAAGTYTQSWAPNGAMLLSADRGDSFQIVRMPIKMGGNNNGRNAGERLAVDPNDGRVLYFGSRLNGLWRSADRGQAWTQVATFPVTGTVSGADVGVIFVQFLGSSGTPGAVTPVIYVGVSATGINGTPFGIYRSTDAGVTWTAVPGQPAGLFPNHAEFGPDGNLYLSYGNDVGPNGMTTGDLWRYTPPNNITPNGAGTWTRITPPAPSYPNNASYGFGTIVTDRQRPGVLMTSSLDLWWQHDNIWRSQDAGATWVELNAPGRSTFDYAVSPWLAEIHPPAIGSPGWWITAMTIDPFNSNRVMYGTGATIWSSSNAQQADSGGVVSWAIGARGIEETAVLALASPAQGPRLISGLGDISGFVHTNLDAAPALASMLRGPTFSTTTSLDVAQAAPTVMARVGHNTGGTPGAYSVDGGTTWSPFASLPPGIGAGAGSIGISADGANFVWSPQDGAAGYYSTNRGVTWTASTGAVANRQVVADRGDTTRFYMPNGTSLLRSINGGQSFSAAGTLPGNGSLYASPRAGGDLWLAADNGLFRSANGGNTFTRLAAVESASRVGFGMSATGQNDPVIFIIGRIQGVQSIFRSLDGGLTWVRITDAQHRFPTAQVITGDPRAFSRVYIGNNGRGIFYGDSPN